MWHHMCDTHEEAKEDQHGGSSRNERTHGTKEVGALLRHLDLIQVQWHAFAETKAECHIV